MTTRKEVNDLKINTLKEKKYNQLLEQGLINEDELYMVVDNNAKTQYGDLFGNIEDQKDLDNALYASRVSRKEFSNDENTYALLKAMCDTATDETFTDFVTGEVFDLSKFTIVGNPTISENGIASGFNGQGVFVHIPNFSFTTNKTIFAGSFILNEFSDNSDILTMQTDLYLTLRCAGNKIAILLGNGNTWIINQLDNSNLKLNYKYYYKLIINTSKVEIYLSENGVDYINTLSLNTTLGLQETTGLLTVGNKITVPDETFTGQIDLSSIRITVDGEEVFKGTKTVTDKVITFPYKKTKDGANIVDIQYKDLVNEYYEKTGKGNFILLDTENKTFRFPLPDIYSLIERNTATFTLRKWED